MGVETALRALEEGAVVHTNLKLKWDLLRERYGPEKLVQLPDNPRKWIQARQRQPGEDEDSPLIECPLIVGGAEDRENLVIIDEASFEFGADDQATKEHKDKLRPVRQLVTLQRHVGIDIIFITQSKKKIDAKLREDASELIHCVKAIGMPFVGWLAQPLFGDFLRIYFDQNGTKVSRTWHRYKQAVGDCYYTHGLRSSVAMRVEPTRQAKTGETGKKGMWQMLAGLALAVLAIGWGAWATFGNLTGGKSLQEIANSTPGAVSPLSPASSRSAAGEVPESHRRGLVSVEWDQEDEWVIAAVALGRRHVVTVRGGLRLSVGADYMGEEITQMVFHRSWYYFITEHGRVVVARPIHPVEREALRQEWIAAEKDIKRHDNKEVAQGSLDAVRDGIKKGMGIE